MVISENIQHSKNLLPQDGEVYLKEDFLSKSECQMAFRNLLNLVPWEQRSIIMFGRSVLQPRLIAWYGDPGCSYKYSGLKLQPRPWIPHLNTLKEKIEDDTKHKYNSALLNLYRHENDSMGYHSDNESELGLHPTIASLSLGSTRKIVFQNIKNKEIKIPINLLDGSLLLMKGETQEHWKHGVLKQSQSSKPRINITFRQIKK